MDNIWMLAYEVEYGEYTHGGTHAVLAHGFFLNQADAEAKIESIEDGMYYVAVKCEPGKIFAMPQYSEKTPLDFSEYPEDFYYNKYPQSMHSVESLEVFAQFALPNKEAEALKFICDYGNHEYTFEPGGLYEMSAWVADSVAKIITGENYPKFLAFTKAGTEGPESYSWQGENVTVKNCPAPRDLELDYESYVVPNSGLTALAAIYSNMTDGAHHIQFAINLAARILTGKNYPKLVKDSQMEWLEGISG